jgi:putative phosphoribosyl transferase
MIFEDRKEAGLLLSSKISFQDRNSVVFAIPRGGVVVGCEIAESLNLPLDIVVVKKIGASNNPELAIGAVGPEKTLYLDESLIGKLGIIRDQISKIKDQKFRERLERERRLRGKKSYEIKNKTIILVDDGAATGATAIAASKFLKKKKAKKIILAVPVIANDTLISIKKYFDEIIYLDNPEEFSAVGQFYKNFPQIQDNEVIELLK